MSDNFLKINYDLLNRTDLNFADKAMISLINSYISQNQEFWMTNSAIADTFGITIKMVKHILFKLKNLGLIQTKLVYKVNSKEVERRFITLTTPSENVPTPSSIRTTPSDYRTTPSENGTRYKIKDKIKDKNKDKNILEHQNTGEKIKIEKKFGNLKEDIYICNTKEEDMAIVTDPYILSGQYSKDRFPYMQQNSTQEILSSDEKKRKIQLEYKLMGEFLQIDKNLLFEYIIQNQEEKFKLITMIDLTPTQKKLCEDYRELVKKELPTERSEEIHL
jgi:hypothetical protein